jgi:tetratricopeptide (TPR) repeat protein
MISKTKIICGCVLLLPFAALNATEIRQTTSGDCSSAIQAGGNVGVNCSKTTVNKTTVKKTTVINNNITNQGAPLEKLIELSKKLGVVENERDNWIKKYQELENQLADSSDEIAKQAKALLNDGKLEDAAQLLQQGLEHDLQAAQLANLKAAVKALSLARIKMLQLDYPAAKTYFHQSVRLDPDHALPLDIFDSHFDRLARYVELVHLYKQELAISEKTLGKEHPDVAIRLSNLANLYHMLRKYAEAEPLYKQALAIDEKVLGKEHPNLAYHLNNLAMLYQAQGKYAEAEPLLQRAVDILKKSLGENHPTTKQGIANLEALQAAKPK